MGVIFKDENGKSHQAILGNGRQSEVIVSSGAIGTPQLLMLSGVGPKEQLQNFNIPLVFTLGKPHLRNMAVGMYSFQGEFSFDWTGFAAGTAISVIPILIVFFVFQNYFVQGMAGAVKG